MRFVPAPLRLRLDARFALVGLLFAAALALAACSGGDDNDEGGGDGGSNAVVALGNDLEDACLIFTAEDAALALDAEVDLVTEPEFEYPDSFLQCQYAERDGTRKAGILVRRGQTLESFRSDVERTEAFTSPEEIRGVADEAFWITGGLNQLMLRDGELTVTVQIISPQLFPTPESVAALRDKNIEVGRIVIQRLRGEVLVANASTATPAPSATRPPGATPAASGTAPPRATPLPPTPTPAPPPPPDLANRSFEDNLFERIADGDWTLGEGLVATLSLFAGELDADDVLRSPAEFAGFESTGVMEMALAYRDDGEDADARAELARLLDRLIFTPDQLAAMAVPATVATLSGEAVQQPIALSMQQSSNEDCQRFYEGAYRVAPGVDQCLLVTEQVAGGIPFRIYLPSIAEAETGWSNEHVVLVQEAISQSVERPLLELGSLPSPMLVVFSATTGSGAAMSAIPQLETGGCTVTVYTAAQRPFFSNSDFKQVLVHEFAHCFQNETFPEQQVLLADRRWREEGFAEYLSSIAYPGNDEELRFVNDFLLYETQEATLGSVSGEVFGASGARSYENVVWFHFLRGELGTAGMLNLIRSGPTVPGQQEQVDFLVGWPDIEELHHDFHLAVVDGTIEDLSGGTYRAGLVFNAYPRLDQTAVVASSLRQFGVAKFLVTVPEGMGANTTFDEGGDLSISARPEESPGDWFPVIDGEEFAATCDGPASFVLVVTSTQDASPFFSMRATSLDELDCDSQPAPTPTPELHVDECVLGTWAFDMSLFSRSIQEQVVGETNVVSVSGDILISFLDDGRMESSIDRLELVYLSPYEGVANRIRVTMTWDGIANGRWSADSDEILIATDEIDVVSSQRISIDGGPPIGGVGLPADDVFGPTLGASGQSYRCSDDTLEIESASNSGEQAVWRRQ